MQLADASNDEASLLGLLTAFCAHVRLRDPKFAFFILQDASATTTEPRLEAVECRFSLYETDHAGYLRSGSSVG